MGMSKELFMSSMDFDHPYLGNQKGLFVFENGSYFQVDCHYEGECFEYDPADWNCEYGFEDEEWYDYDHDDSDYESDNEPDERRIDITEHESTEKDQRPPSFTTNAISPDPDYLRPASGWSAMAQMDEQTDDREILTLREHSQDLENTSQFPFYAHSDVVRTISTQVERDEHTTDSNLQHLGKVYLLASSGTQQPEKHALSRNPDISDYYPPQQGVSSAGHMQDNSRVWNACNSSTTVFNAAMSVISIAPAEQNLNDSKSATESECFQFETDVNGSYSQYPEMEPFNNSGYEQIPMEIDKQNVHQREGNMQNRQGYVQQQGPFGHYHADSIGGKQYSNCKTRYHPYGMTRAAQNPVYQHEYCLYGNVNQAEFIPTPPTLLQIHNNLIPQLETSLPVYQEYQDTAMDRQPLNLLIHSPNPAYNRSAQNAIPKIPQINNNVGQTLPKPKTRIKKADLMSLAPQDRNDRVKEQNKKNSANCKAKQEKHLEEMRNKHPELESRMKELKNSTEVSEKDILRKNQVLSEWHNTNYLYGSSENFFGKFQQEKTRIINKITEENKKNIEHLLEQSTAADQLLSDMKNKEKGDALTKKGTKGSRKTRAKQRAESTTLEYKIRFAEVEIEKFQAISETLEQMAMNIDQFVLENGIPGDIFHEGHWQTQFEPP